MLEYEKNFISVIQKCEKSSCSRNNHICDKFGCHWTFGIASGSADWLRLGGSLYLLDSSKALKYYGLISGAGKAANAVRLSVANSYALDRIARRFENFSTGILLNGSGLFYFLCGCSFGIDNDFLSNFFSR